MSINFVGTIHECGKSSRLMFVPEIGHCENFEGNCKTFLRDTVIGWKIGYLGCHL